MTDKSHRAIPRASQRPELNVEKNQTMPLINPPIDTRGNPSRIKNKTTQQNTYAIPKSVYPAVRSHALKINF